MDSSETSGGMVIESGKVGVVIGEPGKVGRI